MSSGDITVSYKCSSPVDPGHEETLHESSKSKIQMNIQAFNGLK